MLTTVWALWAKVLLLAHCGSSFLVGVVVVVAGHTLFDLVLLAHQHLPKGLVLAAAWAVEGRVIVLHFFSSRRHQRHLPPRVVPIGIAVWQLTHTSLGVSLLIAFLSVGTRACTLGKLH